MTGGPASPAIIAASTEPLWKPAGFWRRYLAWSLDLLLLSPLLMLLLVSPARKASAAWQVLLASSQEWLLDRVIAADGTMADPMALAHALLADPANNALVNRQMAQISAAIGQASLFAACVLALYFIAFESSRWQATPGKRVLGICVQSVAGGPLGLAHTAMRFFAGSLSWLSLNLGHALAAWRHDGRALHDLLSGARVVSATPMPAWARAMLWGQVMVGLLLFASLVLRLFWLLGQLAAL